MNVIKQIIKEGEYGTQTIKMIVRSNERGPKGDKGDRGEAATIEAGNAYSVEAGAQPSVINTGTSSDAVFDFYLPKGPRGDDGKDGKDGAIHYTAGTGINITDSNVIEATGAATAAWGGIQGDITDQTDLQTALQNTASTAETASNNYTDTKLVDYAKTTDIPTVNNATLTIQNNGTNVATFTANSATNTTANIVPPVQIGSVLSTPTNVAYVNANNIVDSAVTTAKIADGAVTNAKIDISLRTSASTIWTGNLYQTSSYIDLDEPLLQGNIYIFTVFGNSDSYLMEFPMTYRNPYFQCAYYDGTTVVRWRFAISNDGTRITLNNQSLNMGSNTALVRIAKVNTNKQS